MAKKRNLQQLRLTHISAVDKPCQEGAKALCIKRAPDPEDDEDEMKRRKEEVAECAKYVCETDGAHTFAEVLRENKFSQEIWPCVDALSQSIRSIVGDSSLTGGEREAKINASVDQFLSSVREITPEVSKQLEELVVRKKEGPMPKTVEELQADLNKANSDLAAANTRADTEKARADTAEAALATEKTAHETTKVALVTATDETITVGGETIKRSEAGNGAFNVAKALRDERDTARLEKRASEDFRHAPGSASDKALVLKIVDHLPDEDPTKKAVLATLTAAEKMAKLGFERLGVNNGQTESQKAATQQFDDKVDELVKGGMAKAEAMSKARRENPDLFEASQSGATDAVS